MILLEKERTTMSTVMRGVLHFAIVVRFFRLGLLAQGLFDGILPVALDLDGVRL